VKRGLLAGALVTASVLSSSAALAAPPPTPPAASTNLADAQQRLAAVYARPPLDRLDLPRGSTPLDAIVSRLGDLFSRLQSGLGTGGELAVGLLAAAVIGGLAYVLLRRVSAGRRVVAPPDDPGDAGVDADAEWTAAEAAAARGDLREAVRRAFRSALLAIAVAGRLPVDAAWTTRELLANTAADADLLATLAPAAAAFDVAWYSGRPVSTADWEAQRSRCGAIRAMARRGRSRVPATGRER
jgi:hypothetical protein